MAVRFGAQQHPSGGLRYGSQEYAAVNAVAGALSAAESGRDVLAADSYPRINGSVGAVESGADALVATGISSLVRTMQAHESLAPDGFVSTGSVTINVGGVRFGSQGHPGGGLRFGSQSWATLGPNASLAATETGSDGLAAIGFLLGSPYTFAAFDILASFVNYSSESIGAGIVGTLDTGYKVLLPVAASGGITFTWETNDFRNPSLRLAQLVGTRVVDDVPWYVWDGSAWTAATFDVSDAIQGAVFISETGADIFSANADQTRYGSAALNEGGADSLQAVGGVAVRGGLATNEGGGDTFAVIGEPLYIGRMWALELTGDTFAAPGGVVVSSSIALVESANADSFAAYGQLVSTGDLSVTETGADSLAVAGYVVNGGALSGIESVTPDVAAVAGVVRVSGALGCVESGADAFSIAGRLERSGLVSAVEGGVDAIDIDGEVRVSGTFAATDALDTFASTGTRESIGDLTAAELAAADGGADRFVSRGRIGNVVPIATFDGPVTTSSRTRVVKVLARRTAEAA